MKIIHKIILVGLITSGLISCNKLSEFGDINSDPSKVNKPVIGALLTNVQANLGGYAFNTRGGLYAQYFSETQYTEASLYQTPELAFTGYYSGLLNDLQNIINTNESNNQTVVATILQQYIYWTITNFWGDVPYSEALQGATNLKPKYDTQEDIYKSIFEKLGKAVTSFDNSLITGDIMFNGNIESWKRTANSLKALAALQLSKKVPASNGFAATAFKEALAANGGVITTNSQNLVLKYPGGTIQSPYFTIYLTRFDYGQSAFFTDMMKSYGDARQGKYGSSDVGVPYGLARVDAEKFTAANAGWSRIFAPSVRVENAPVYIISAAHVALARAEAAELGWTNEDVSTLYKNGIELSHQQWGVEVASNYLSNSKVDLSSAGSRMEKIIMQRYIANYPDGTQAWNIWRKTGVPELTPAPAALNSSKQIPRRYVYATAEFASNPVNVKAAVDRIAGGNTQDARVWWDTN